MEAYNHHKMVRIRGITTTEVLPSQDDQRQRCSPQTRSLCPTPTSFVETQPIHDDDHKDDDNNNYDNVDLKFVKVFSPNPFVQVNPGNKKGLGVASLNLTNIQVAFDPILNITRII